MGKILFGFLLGVVTCIWAASYHDDVTYKALTDCRAMVNGTDTP